jgi:bifunctional DNase/RNase
VETQPLPAPGRDWGPPYPNTAAEGVVPAPGVRKGTFEGPLSRPQPAPFAAREVLVAVVRLIISEVHEQQVASLREVGGGRSFFLACGIFEATSLDRMLKRFPSPRPLTHDAWADTIAALGGKVESVCITDLREQIYYAEVRVRLAARLVAVDVRPSDAFIVALKCAAPVLVAERVLDEVSAPQ